MMESSESSAKVLDENNESEASSSEVEEDVDYDEELHSKHKEFANEIMNCLKKFFDTDEESNQNVESSGYSCSNIARAILTISYVFRVDYRRIYLSIRHLLIRKEKYEEFCSVIGVEKNALYFFYFMKRISLIFEISMYLLKEGYDYFHIACECVADYQDLLYFESEGGLSKLNKVASFIVAISADLQLLVENEHPQTEKLLSFPDTLLELEAKYNTVSDTKLLESLRLLKAINVDFYSGLQKYSDKHVLPFLILRFMLQGRLQPFIPPKPNCKENVHGLDEAEIGILMYLDKCLIPEIMSGVAYRRRNRTPVPTDSERNTSSEDEGSSICDTFVNSEEESPNSNFIHSHSSDPLKNEKDDLYRNLSQTKMLYPSAKSYLLMLITEMEAFSEEEKSRLSQVIRDIPEEKEFGWHEFLEQIPDSGDPEEGIDLISLLSAVPDSAEYITAEFISLICGISAVSLDEFSLPKEESTILGWSMEERRHIVRLILSSPESPGDGKVELIRMLCDFSNSEDS